MTGEEERFMYHDQHLKDADNMFRTKIGWETPLKDPIYGSYREVEKTFCVFTGVECSDKNSCRNCKVAFDPYFDRKRQNIYEHYLNETIKRFGLRYSDDRGLFTTKHYEQPLPKEESE